MMIDNSFELLERLRDLGYDNSSRDPWWWPNSGTFEVVVGAILTQNASWERVEISLENLRKEGLLAPEKIAQYPKESLEKLIRPSGFFRAKSENLKRLSENMVKKFASFDSFRQECEREWLLSQRGIGPESADAILNYACYREVFVVDSYTARLLAEIGYEMTEYGELQNWMLDGMRGKEAGLLPGFSSAQVYARAHGMVVEYCKSHRRGRRIDTKPLFAD
jgi:endonuclease-3 related protein